MADFSLADAISDDGPRKAPTTAYNPSAPSAPGWPGAAPGGPNVAPASGPAPGAPGQFPGMPSGQAGYPSGPGMPGQFPGAPGQFPSAPGQLPGAPGQLPGAPGQFPGAPGQFPGAPGQFPGAPGQFPGAPGQFPGAPGQFPGAPGQFPGAPGQFPGAPGQFPSASGQFPSPPGAPQAPYPGMYGPGGPGSFPPGQGFSGAAFPPVPAGSWGFGPQSTGPYGGAPAPGGMLPVPYDLPLHAGIMPRLLITVVGVPVPGGERFQVDFMKGPDIVFHFNPRFNEQTIVRNSNLNGYWGPEEREGGYPFVQGQQFELKILVEENVYKVAVDGVHLLEYEHREGGMEQVTLVRVLGDVDLYSIGPSMI